MATRGRTIGLVVVALLLLAAAFLGMSPHPAAAADEPPRVEITELRDSTSKTYQLSDGRYEWVGYPEAIHYLDSSGAFQDIDNSIVAEDKQIDGARYVLRNAANQYTVRFGATTADSPLVNMESRGASIGFDPVNSGPSSAIRPDTFLSKVLSDSAVPQNSVAYHEIYPGTDLFYEAKTYGVKEFIVLNEPTGQNEFAFHLSLNGLTVKEANGRISFVDQQGEEVFFVGEPYVVDDAGVPTNEVTCTVSEDAGAYRLSITVDKAYLDDPDRAYPVAVDPTIVITGVADTFDSFVSSRYPDSNYYLSTYIRTGRDADYYTRRTYMKFNLPSLAPSKVITAYLRIEKYSGATPEVAGYRVTGNWSSSTVTWNNKPGYSTSNPSTYGSPDGGAWWRMYCTTMVKYWLGGTYANYGFCLKDHTESGTGQWTTFYSSDASSPHKPELHIEYVYCGNRDYESVTSGSINCMGYALGYDAWVDPTTVSGVNGCTTLSSLLTYVQTQSQTWMGSHSIGYDALASYVTDIGQSQYRVVLRVGWVDLDGDNDVDYTDDWDFHWWYQTPSGQWAQKQASSPSSWVSGSSATTDPYSLSWPKGSNPSFYTSSCRYWAIDN